MLKLNTKEFYHFISAKLFNTDKDELNKEKNENNIKNPLIKIRMYQEKNEKKKSNENNNKNSNEKVFQFLQHIQKRLKINLMI